MIALCAVLRKGRLVGPFRSEVEAYRWVSRQAWYQLGVSRYEILALEAPEPACAGGARPDGRKGHGR